MPRKPLSHVRILIHRTWAIGHNTAGFKLGDERMNTKLIKKLSLGAESCVTIIWKPKVFSHTPKFKFDLHGSF